MQIVMQISSWRAFIGVKFYVAFCPGNVKVVAADSSLMYLGLVPVSLLALVFAMFLFWYKQASEPHFSDCFPIL